MNPLIPVLALGAAGFALLSSKKSSALAPSPSTPSPAATVPPLPATSAPASSAAQTVKVGAHTWKLVTVNATAVDVFAPAGSWGPHGELRVCRFTPIGQTRILSGAAEGVPKAVLDAAIKDLRITIPGGAIAPAAPAATTPTTPSGAPSMPASLQAEVIAVMGALGVDASGTVRGPTTAEAVQHATELSSRLDQAGFPQAAAMLRAYAQAGAKLLPPAPTPAPIPGVPAETASAIDRALRLERDPAKLEALRASLATLPPSAQRDLLIGSLDALILQVRSAQAMSQAATDIDEMTRAAQAATAPKPPAPSSGQRLLKLTKPNMTGPDVKAWQLVLKAAGYNIDTDGAFGPGTESATKDWQKKRSLSPDGQVGPDTRAKIGTPPTAPLAVPATASPRVDPAPKSALEINAEAAATHLRAVQAKYGVSGSKGKQDVALVKRFQSAAGGYADGMPGPGTMLALAKAGQGLLPAVMYWPKNGTKAKDLPAYRSQLAVIAQAARNKGQTTLASQIEASAAREVGAGGLA